MGLLSQNLEYRRNFYIKKLCAIILSFVMVAGLFSTTIHAVDSIANAKIDTELIAAIEESVTSTASAYITMSDISEDAILALFKQQHPNEYKAYMYAKYDIIEDMTPEEIETIDEEMLQRAIEYKREIARELYTEENRQIVNQYFSDDEVLFISSYAPVAIVNSDSGSVSSAARSTDILSIESYTEAEAYSTVDSIQPSATNDISYDYDALMSGIDLANQISRADTVRDGKGWTGDGVKIGVIEVNGIPDLSNPYLASANITIRSGDSLVSDHATAVVSILVAEEADGTMHGIVPDADIYCCSISNTSTFLAGIEWLIDSGVNIINASLGLGSYNGTYDSISSWIDHLAMQHDVHFVKSAGNSSNYITSPGMAYNAITVGNFEANGSDDITGFTIASSSSYMETATDGLARAEKPNLVANGCFENAGINGSIRFNWSGTSFAAPQVAGVIAQLCDHTSKLKTKQTQIGAILTASSAEKIDAVGSGVKGGSFLSDVRVERNYQISNVEGVGILDALWAWGIVANHNHWSTIVYSGNFPYTHTITIDASKNVISRISIFWLKRNLVTDHTSTSISTSDTLPNLDLYIYDPDGELLGSSRLTYANFEVVQFAPPCTGTYTIIITGSTDTQVNVGISLW